MRKLLMERQGNDFGKFIKFQPSEGGSDIDWGKDSLHS